MLATSGALPADLRSYALEVKWDGIRAIAYVHDGVRITGRKGTDFTRRYPEVATATEDLARTASRVILDGEVVAFDESGRPSFELLQRRMHVENPAEAGLLTLIPVRYLPFDLLYLDGRVLFAVPYAERRAMLSGLDLDVPPFFPGEGGDLLAATREQGLEGVVAKRLDSPYRPGRRTDWWIKVKHLSTREVVIAGWRPGAGKRAGGVGSLLMGAFGERGLTYIGHVGTGFSDAALDDLLSLLAPLEAPGSPYADRPPAEVARNAHWVRPEVVGEVAYTMWTREGRLRNPVWRGLRPDVLPSEVRL
ncbi:non-homologous end-joining DNA ligase [Sinosporangium album]|nr:non-homologous end-joining DNA ligase [Sinosporangium album]